MGKIALSLFNKRLHKDEPICPNCKGWGGTFVPTQHGTSLFIRCTVCHGKRANPNMPFDIIDEEAKWIELTYDNR